MATALWRCFLADRPLLQKLKTVKSYKNAVESKNIVTFTEFSVFVWNSDEQNVLTVTLNSLDNANLSEFQILMLSNPPSFDVDILQFNHGYTLLAINGKHGVSIVELPRRWGKEGNFEGGQERVMCKTWGIASRFFTCNTRIRISQVSWHPGSASDCHLCILSSDNYLRVYDVTDPQTSTHVYNLGEQSPNCYLSSTSNMSFSASLGEVSVSFDFGSPKRDPSASNGPNGELPIWPIFILKGNGDVFIVNSTLKKIRTQVQQLMGPLKMYPPAEDNYGVDACSLLCLQSTPPVLVIVTCSGVIYHCVALGTSDNEPEISWPEGEIKESPADVSLYVYESIELSLFMAQSETNEDDAFSCPVRLHKDPTVNFRYHCTHIGGLHAVAVPFIQQLEIYLDHENLSILQEQESIVEHLICTRPFPSSPSAPILGLAVASTPLGATLICLLSTWEFVCLPLISACQTLPSTLCNKDDKSDGNLRASRNNDFVQTLVNVLQCSTHTPLLRTTKPEPGSEPSPQQCLELLGNMTQRLREEYLNRLEVASTQVERRKLPYWQDTECLSSFKSTIRVKILTQQKKQLNSDLEKCLRSRDEMRNNAEKLAEKYEEINLTQHKIHKRLESLLENIQRRLPILSDEEINMQKELQKITKKMNHLSNSFQQIELKFNFQQQQMNQDDIVPSERSSGRYDNRSSDFSLDSIQTKQIRELLSKQGSTIAELVSKVTWLKKELGL